MQKCSSTTLKARAFIFGLSEAVCFGNLWRAMVAKVILSALLVVVTVWIVGTVWVLAVHYEELVPTSCLRSSQEELGDNRLVTVNMSFVEGVAAWATPNTIVNVLLSRRTADGSLVTEVSASDVRLLCYQRVARKRRGDFVEDVVASVSLLAPAEKSAAIERGYRIGAQSIQKVE